mmetsp:Transcript_24806/g.34988  ORF Transcript_24806/g.34988 Transcript_24806/m.34988 type:complete len:1017 (+) Transcript_24806:311-3361(+)
MGNEPSKSKSSSSQNPSVEAATEQARKVAQAINKNIQNIDGQAIIDNVCGGVMDPDERTKLGSRSYQSGYSEDSFDNESRSLYSEEDTMDSSYYSRRTRDGDSVFDQSVVSKEERKKGKKIYNDDSVSYISGDDDSYKPHKNGKKKDSVPVAENPSDVGPGQLSKPLASSFAKRCYFTKAGIGKTTQHYEGLTLTGNVVLMLASAMKLKGCPTICDEDLRRVEQTYPNQFSRLPDELLLSSGWRRISKFCHFSNKPIADGVPFFHSRDRIHPTGGFYFLLASAVGMVRPIDVEPLTRDTLVLLETDFPSQCDAAPESLIQDATQWTLVNKFCFFSGGPINTEEDVYYQADFDGSPIFMLAFLSPSLTPEELYKLGEAGAEPGLQSVAAVQEVESVYDLTSRDFDDLKLYHLGPCRALPPYILQPEAWSKVLPPHFLMAKEQAMLRAAQYENPGGIPMQQYPVDQPYDQQQGPQPYPLQGPQMVNPPPGANYDYGAPAPPPPGPQQAQYPVPAPGYEQPGYGPPPVQGAYPPQQTQPWQGPAPGAPQGPPPPQQYGAYPPQQQQQQYPPQQPPPPPQQPVDGAPAYGPYYGETNQPAQQDSRDSITNETNNFQREMEEEGAFVSNTVEAPIDEALAAENSAHIPKSPPGVRGQAKQSGGIDPPDDEPPSLSRPMDDAPDDEEGAYKKQYDRDQEYYDSPDKSQPAVEGDYYPREQEYYDSPERRMDDPRFQQPQQDAYYDGQGPPPNDQYYEGDGSSYQQGNGEYYQPPHEGKYPEGSPRQEDNGESYDEQEPGFVSRDGGFADDKQFYDNGDRGYQQPGNADEFQYDEPQPEDEMSGNPDADAFISPVSSHADGDENDENNQPASPEGSQVSYDYSHASSAMRGAQEYLKKKRQQRFHQKMETGRPSSPNDESVATYDTTSDLNTSIVSGSSVWTDSSLGDKSSRRALILQMAKARMKTNKSSGGSVAGSVATNDPLAITSQPTPIAEEQSVASDLPREEEADKQEPEIDFTGELD